MMNRILIVAIAVLIAGCESVEYAESPEELAARYVGVVNTKSDAELRNLVHPDCFAGLSRLQQEFMNDMLAREFRRPIPQKHAISISALDSESEPFSDMVVWKVKPTHQVQIDFSKDNHSKVSIVRFFAKTKEGWCIILPVLNEENLKKYKEKKESQQSPTGERLSTSPEE